MNKKNVLQGAAIGGIAALLLSLLSLTIPFGGFVIAIPVVKINQFLYGSLDFISEGLEIGIFWAKVFPVFLVESILVGALLGYLYPNKRRYKMALMIMAVIAIYFILDFLI